MYNILKRQYNYFIRGVIRINEEVQRNWTYWFKRFVKLCLLSKNYPFGSHAYGTPNEDSEFDLCIVVEGVGARKRGVINRINWGIYDVMETQVDILVYGPEEFLERASRTVTMEHKIALNGRTVPKLITFNAAQIVSEIR